MDQPKKVSPWRRRLLVTAAVLGGLGAACVVWFAFFPVPLGWAARIGISRALPEEGTLQVELEAVTFRWRWGHSSLAIEVRGITATSRTRPLATVEALIVELPKKGLWNSHFAPSQITLVAPHVILDQTPEGALTQLSPTKPPPQKPATPTAPTEGSAPDLKPLAKVLPARGEATKLVITDFAVHVRTKAGDARVPFGRIETNLAQNSGGVLQLDMALPLIAGLQPPRLTFAASLDAGTGRGDFSVKLPAFATNDIPVLPGAPPLPLQATVALDVTGHYDLAAMRLDDVAGGISIIDGELSLPDQLAAKLRLERVELRGRADLRTQRAVLEVGRVRIGPLEINIAELETSLGEHSETRWRLEIAGLRGSSILPLLPPSVRTLIPLPDEAVRLLALNRATTRGTFTALRDAEGAWSSNTMKAEGQFEFGLGAEKLVCNWSAGQPLGGDRLTFEILLPPFVPGRWPAVLLEGTPVGAVDVPLAFTAQLTLSPRGAPRAARIGLTGAPGTLKPLQKGMPPLSVRRLEVRMETENYDSAWRVPVARLDLANGAGVELLNTNAERRPGQFTVEGDAQATGLSGDFIALWLPPDTWAPLTAAGLEPRGVLLSRVGAHFNATAFEHVGGGWKPKALTLIADAELRLNGVPLKFTAQASLPDGATQLDAAVALAEFRPSQMRVTLMPGLTTGGFDFPVSLDATVRANLKGELSAATARFHTRAGRLKTPLAFGDLDLPVTSLDLEANYDPVRQRAEVPSLRLDAAGLLLNLSGLTATTVAPYAASGRMELDPFALAPLLKLWPTSQEPELRKTVVTTLRAGEFGGAKFDFAATYDPAAKSPLSPLKVGRLEGTVSLSKVDAALAAVPGPIALGALKAIIDYPKATLELENVSAPGVRLTAASVQVSALDQATPLASVTARFDADLIAANRAWKFAPPNAVLSGTASGNLSLQAPFSAATVDARIGLDLTRAKVALPGLANAAPATLNVSARVLDALATDKSPTATFSIDSQEWLGTPLRVVGRATVTPKDFRPTAFELTTYEHGRTNLQVKFVQPDATHQALSLTGSMLDMGPLMRIGLAAADAFAAVPAPAPAKKPATAPKPPVVAAPVAATTPAAPMTVNVDARVDQIEFSPTEKARQFELHTRLENSFPMSLTLHAVSNMGNAMRADLEGPAAHQKFKFLVGDVAGWMRALTAPWAGAAPPAGQFGSLVAQMIKVPAIVSGGGLTVEADLRPDETDWVQGRLEISRAMLVRPPRVLQMVALKSGKALQSAPLIENFTIGELALSRTRLSVAGISLVGSGLANNLKVKSATYGLANEALTVDGAYFGVGFEVSGTLAKPQVYLKDDNKLIRAIGTRNEFDFDDPVPAPAPKPKK